jgi:FHA domain
MIKCSECGYENIDGLDYCDGCGAKLDGASTEPASPPPPPAPSPGPAAAPAESSAAPEPSAPPETSSADAAHVEASNGAAAAASEPAESSASQAPTGEIKAPEPAPVPSPGAPAEPAHFRAKLSLIRGGRKGQEFPLEDGRNLIGRWDPETGSFPEVDLEQDDPEAKISRKHAMIIIENGRITVEDIGSLNGTYVNRGNRLIPGSPLEVKSGDELIIGKTFLKLVVDPIS